MRTALLALAGLLILGLMAGLAAYEVQHFATDLANARADLDKEATANKTQAAALAALRADRDQDAVRVSGLVQKLQAISDEQTAQRAAFAKVKAHATPAEKAVLDSQLPDSVVRLFPPSGGPAATGTSNPSIRP